MLKKGTPPNSLATQGRSSTRWIRIEGVKRGVVLNQTQIGRGKTRVGMSIKDGKWREFS